MMASVFVPMIGFYLVNGGIKKDIDTGVGMMIATTAITNFQYLLSKFISNFLVLLSITAGIFSMAVLLFLFRETGYVLHLSQFMAPYLLITVPVLLLTASIAVIAEMFLYRYTIIMNIGYFIIFFLLLSLQSNSHSYFDLFGSRQVTEQMRTIVAAQTHQDNPAVSMGFYLGHNKDIQTFTFKGLNWPESTITNRIILGSLGVFLILASARFFHRFDSYQEFRVNKKRKIQQDSQKIIPSSGLKLSKLPPVTNSYHITPFVKTELLMLFRKGPKWLWLINFAGITALTFVQLNVSHEIILPVLWFLQVGRWSDIASKERANRVHYYAYASYKPLTRLLPAQILAGCLLAWLLSIPLLLRYLAHLQFIPAVCIILGGICIVVFAVALGILTKGKKLFEILFFLFTYANIQKIPYTDYFGGLSKGLDYMILIVMIIGFLTAGSFFLRKQEYLHM